MFYVKVLCIGNSVGKVIHENPRACVCMYILFLIMYKNNNYSGFLHVSSFFVRNLNIIVRIYCCFMVMSF